LTSKQLTRLHHFSLKGRAVSLPVVIAYFQGSSSLRGNNIALAERCRYVAETLQSRSGALTNVIEDALLKFPLGGQNGRLPKSGVAPQKTRVALVRASPAPAREHQKLGDRGETFALQLLRGRGYSADLLPRNYPTYDIKAAGSKGEFYVSVKTSRTRQHVRLGTRDSVERLSPGNFVFAFLPLQGAEIDLSSGRYRLLILPADMVKRDSLTIHDTYWAERERTNEYSVMVKGYDSSHHATWERWGAFVDGWREVPD